MRRPWVASQSSPPSLRTAQEAKEGEKAASSMGTVTAKPLGNTRVSSCAICWVSSILAAAFAAKAAQAPVVYPQRSFWRPRCKYCSNAKKIPPFKRKDRSMRSLGAVLSCYGTIVPKKACEGKENPPTKPPAGGRGTAPGWRGLPPAPPRRSGRRCRTLPTGFSNCPALPRPCR